MNNKELIPVEYPLGDLTLLTRAVELLIQSGVHTTPQIMQYKIRTKQIFGQKIGRDWWILTTEIQKIIDTQEENAS